MLNDAWQRWVDLALACIVSLAICASLQWIARCFATLLNGKSRRMKRGAKNNDRDADRLLEL